MATASTNLTGVVTVIPGSCEIKRHAADSFIRAGGWYHLVMTYNAGNLAFYSGQTNEATSVWTASGAAQTVDLSDMLVGNLIKEQFLGTRDWPFGSTLSIMLTIAVLLFVWIAAKLGSTRGRYV